MGLFDDISFHHIPREENQVANVFATLLSMFKIGPHGDFSCIDIRCHIKPAHCCFIEEGGMVSLGILISNNTSRTRNTRPRPLKMTRGHYEVTL